MNPWIERALWVAAVAVLAVAWNHSESQNTRLADLVVRQSNLMERQSTQLDSIHAAFDAVAEDPHTALKQSLMDRADLLGGRFRIFSIDDIRILNSQWAYATYEDGHLMQAGLFRYTRSPDGGYRWTLVERMEF